MKSTLSVLLLLVLTNTSVAQLQKDQFVLSRVIHLNHFSPRQMNDSFSSAAFDKIISYLGEPQLLFTQPEYDRLNAFRYQLDDEITGQSNRFLSLFQAATIQGAKRADSIIRSVLVKPLDLTRDETVAMSYESNLRFYPTVSDLAQAWTKQLKLHMLNRIYDLLQSETTGKPVAQVYSSKEPALRARIKKEVTGHIGDLLSEQFTAIGLKSVYMNAIANTFDPHTGFFSEKEMDYFNASLSTQEESFGFLVDEKDGKILIEHLLPGGPAWKTGQLHKNDQLLQISVNDSEPSDVTLLSLEDVYEMMDRSSSTKISLKIRKMDGSINQVILQKEKVVAEEAKVKGYVLKGAKKIGYISLPDFYTMFPGGEGSSCAEDMGKEIVNLKKEGIEGLILDVRYNGGGSLNEALALIGIFIESGPLLGIKEKQGKVTYLKDPYRGTIYDGPLVILVNGQSASASEALAGAMQDYNRAVIAGSTTFGKGTMQVVMPLDTTASSPSSHVDFVKVTIGKFYRLNGSTVQRAGVQPDVYLPDPFENISETERGMMHSLSADTITANKYYKPLSPLPLQDLRSASLSRLGSDTAFIRKKQFLLQQGADKKKVHMIPLKLEKFIAWTTQYEKSLMYEGEESVHNVFTVVNHGFENQLLKNDSYARELNSVLLKNVQTDIYIREGYLIVSDLIQRTSK